MRAVGSLCGLALICAGLAPYALAGTPVQSSPVSPPGAGQSMEGQQVKGLGKRVDAATLQKLSGGSDVSQEMMLTGTVSNNQSDHLLTGDNALNGGSFNGAAGLNTVIQNTGNGVLIQNATIVNVQVQP
jgi:hypothetical protein